MKPQPVSNLLLRLGLGAMLLVGNAFAQPGHDAAASSLEGVPHQFPAATLLAFAVAAACTAISAARYRNRNFP